MSALHLITTRNADVAALRIWADDVDKIGDARLAPKIALPADGLFTASKGERWDPFAPTGGLWRTRKRNSTRLNRQKCVSGSGRSTSGDL
jgi:hypothetical protein